MSDGALAIDEARKTSRRAATVQRRAHTLEEFATSFGIAKFTVQRLISHGLLKTIHIGAKPLIPEAEAQRIERDGLPSVPPGYKRQSAKPHARRTKRAR
jgi:hypothetical protein